MRRESGDYEPLFTLESWRVLVEKRADGRVETERDGAHLGPTACATCDGRGQRARQRARPGAARRARRDPPAPARHRLVNYKVRILDQTKGTDAVTRVLHRRLRRRREWGSIGVSENVIEASWDALVDSLEQGMQPVAARASSPAAASLSAGADLVTHGGRRAPGTIPLARP